MLNLCWCSDQKRLIYHFGRSHKNEIYCFCMFRVSGLSAFRCHTQMLVRQRYSLCVQEGMSFGQINTYSPRVCVLFSTAFGVRPLPPRTQHSPFRPLFARLRFISIKALCEDQFVTTRHRPSPPPLIPLRWQQHRHPCNFIPNQPKGNGLLHSDSHKYSEMWTSSDLLTDAVRFDVWWNNDEN